MKATIAVLLSCLLLSCSHQADITSQLKSGDLIFRERSNEALSQAIDEVTQTKKGSNFSHMGILQIENEKVWVLHSAPEKGVAKEFLDSFTSTETKSAVYRITGLNDDAIAKALAEANSLIGAPYNFTYLIPDSGYYCSEFVYHLFEGSNVFKLEPMTFKSPKSDSFPNAWVQHYQDLGIQIPEGLPGCNPNGMAASEKLKFIISL